MPGAAASNSRRTGSPLRLARIAAVSPPPRIAPIIDNPPVWIASICVGFATKNGQRSSTYNSRAPRRPLTAIQSTRSSTGSVGSPRRCASQRSSQIPTSMPAATARPYQENANSPKWKRFGSKLIVTIRDDSPVCERCMTDHLVLLPDFPQKVDNAGQVHCDTEPEQWGLVGVQEDGGAGDTHHRQHIGQVMGAAGQHRRGARSTTGCHAANCGAGVQPAQIGKQLNLRAKAD